MQITTPLKKPRTEGVGSPGGHSQPWVGTPCTALRFLAGAAERQGSQLQDLTPQGACWEENDQLQPGLGARGDEPTSGHILITGNIQATAAENWGELRTHMCWEVRL